VNKPQMSALFHGYNIFPKKTGPFPRVGLRRPFPVIATAPVGSVRKSQDGLTVLYSDAASAMIEVKVCQENISDIVGTVSCCIERSNKRIVAVKVIVAKETDRKSTRLNSSHVKTSYAVFCLKTKKEKASTKTQ